MFLTRKAKERIGAGIGALAVLLLFGGVGLMGIYAVGGTLHDGWRARGWVPTEARIMPLDAGRLAYTYEWQERRYTGDRVGTFVLGGNSRVDDWDDRLAALISKARSEESPVTVYVNPSDPRESMLNREIRWKLLLLFLPFAVGFTGAGLFAFVMIGRKALGQAESYAGVPWLRPRAREALTQWAVGIAWNVVALPIGIIAIPEFWGKGEWFPLVLCAIFPLFGLLILWSALLATVAVLREGSPFNARTAT